jgi:polyhydroxybutyrate depolymerase
MIANGMNRACAWRVARHFTLLALATLAAACSKSSASPAPSKPANSLVAGRPFGLEVPPSYDPGKPAPLLLALHAFGSDGNDLTAANWDVAAIALAHGVFVAHPNGTLDRWQHRFWNATDACCNFGDSKVDDVAYLVAVIDDVSARYRIDPKRVWVTGISNGGFMAHRLACDRADKVAAIASIAGAAWADPARCTPTAPVSVLEVHGADDPVVKYAGGTGVLDGKAPYPSVEATVAQSASRDGCTGALVTSAAPSGLAGSDPATRTEVAKWSGCPAGIDVERWRMLGTGHIPRPPRSWSETLVAWLEQHPRP